VYIAPKKFELSIRTFGLDPTFFHEGKIYLTKLKYIQQKTPQELEKILYRKELQPLMKGKFTEGGAIKIIVKKAIRAKYRGLTNKAGGIPQYTCEEPIPPDALIIEDIL